MTAALAPIRTEDPTAPARPVTLRPMPRREPPFDDECDHTGTGHAEPERAPHPGTVTRFDRHLPFDAPAAAPALWQAWPPRGHGPDASAWARRLLVALVEAAGGKRPMHQLAALFSPSVARGLGTQFGKAAAAGSPHWLRHAAVRSVHASEPADDVVEVCAVLDSGISGTAGLGGTRVRAVAMRVERHRGQWRCTRLQLG